VIDPADRADAGAYLSRLVRLDSAALVRLRPIPGGTEMWAMLPFRVLVVRTLGKPEPEDITVRADELLGTLLQGTLDGSEHPRRRDAEWRWPLPPSRGREIEHIPAVEIARVAAAASRTLRTAAEEGVGGRAVGQRMLRDALLDHVPIVVTSDTGERVDVPQRMVQGLVRMGFLGSVTAGDNSVTVRLAMGWIGIDGSYGSAWYRPIAPLRLG
jgi:hypothetical protein